MRADRHQVAGRDRPVGERSAALVGGLSSQGDGGPPRDLSRTRPDGVTMLSDAPGSSL
jgi:hypothetical protein